MFLKRAILINWGNIPHIELEFGPVNLFSGGNGSGKTTAADAIQALMTAAHENLFAFNPGQDETTQKGRGGKQVRTLASYLLGCDDGSYARTGTHDAYVAGVFCPTQGEDCEPFTAVMAMRGHLEKSGAVKQARLDELFFLVVPFEQLQLNHFVKQDSGGKYVLPVERLAPNLKKEFGAGAVEVYDKKGAYLRRLYGALRGRKDSVSDREARHAARTFSGFMAYKPVKSIHEFVAGEILEPRDLGEAIRSVSDLMKTIHDMEAKAATIKETVQLLERARQVTDEYQAQWTGRMVHQYASCSANLWRVQQVYLKNKNEQKLLQQKIAELQDNIEQIDSQRQQLHQAIVHLEARRQGIPALRDKDLLQQDIARQQKKLAEFARPVLSHLQQLQANVDAAAQLLEQLQRTSVAVDIPVLEQKDFLQLTRQVAQNSDARDLDARQLLNQDWIDPSTLNEKITAIIAWQNQQNRWVEQMAGAEFGASDSVREAVYVLVARRNETRQRLQRELSEKSREIHLLKDEQVKYPAYVEHALKAIREALPAADPKVLCDYVEVADARWQMAIEGYMGGARFGIIVEPEWEAEAIRTLRNMRSERTSKARIIQGTKAGRDAERTSSPPDSILELMTFSHSTAADYLKVSYGSVVQVPDAETLKTTARGLTADGLASGNYAMWRCDLGEGELVFGKSARQRALKARELELERLTQSAREAEQAYQQALELQEICQRVKPVQLYQPLQEMLHIQTQLQSAEQALANLDLKDAEFLEQELRDKNAEYLAAEQKGKQGEQELGGLKQQLHNLEQAIRQLADKQEHFAAEKDVAEQAVLAIVQVLPRFDAETALQAAEQAARNDDEDYEEQIRSCSERLNFLERELFKITQIHNQSAATQDQLIYDAAFTELHSAAFFQHWVHMSGAIEALHNRLKNNILVERHRQLRQLKDSFNTAFVTNLCHSIYQAINEGKNILEDLNRELSHHCFGSDRERFYFAMEWVPEYQEYWQFFKTIINIPNLGDGATLFELDLPPKQAATRDRLLVMLLDEDQQTAHRELARISDYRNYRRYEIYKQPENKEPIALSQYGTGSGGQLETPAYIIRAAAVTSAFRFNEGKSHLRMVMVDEAFSKMDETRSREVIRYLTESLGLQLIFIMPTSKSGPFLDMISNQLVFSKCPTQQPIGELKTRVLVDRKVCRQDQIARLWANHRKTIRHQAALDFMDGIWENNFT
jgi:energy-coupling factor transporter ATP-binding protein EcfA2